MADHVAGWQMQESDEARSEDNQPAIQWLWPNGSLSLGQNPVRTSHNTRFGIARDFRKYRVLHRSIAWPVLTIVAK
jgi:hypothetical protein